MDRNEKFLKKLSRKELRQLTKILSKIKAGDTKDLNLKKLVGHSDIYRVRFGELRIIFLVSQGQTNVLEISRRSNRTYKKR